jgi:hypothetical protein
MVTALKISAMKWVIADLNQIRLALSVKEQRVDGSSKSRNLDFVRCTLVAGKPVLGRKIPFHPNNCKIVSGLLSAKAFIHTTRSMEDNLTLSKQYIWRTKPYKVKPFIYNRVCRCRRVFCNRIIR